MGRKSRRILTQMGIVSLIAAVTLAALLIWKFSMVLDWALGDLRPLVLNGIILVLFALGTARLYRAVRHYQVQEDQVEEYIQRRQAGEDSAAILHGMSEPSLLVDRYRTVKQSFDSGGPIDHGALSAIMMAEESLHQSFPRFVNNVLILTGVFGTVSSLIFALVGAGDVLLASSPDAGMGLLLLGMNTALTTTATAIVCYFYFTFFFHRLTDLQTWVFSRIERADLLYMTPEFTFEPEAVNHQTKQLIEEVRHLVGNVRQGLLGIEVAVKRIQEEKAAPSAEAAAMQEGLDRQNTAMDATLTRLDDLRQVLVEGFRLNR
jgi:hypothetical protein